MVIIITLLYMYMKHLSESILKQMGSVMPPCIANTGLISKK